MKRMIPLLCALAMLLVGCVPVLAASEDRPYYPVAVEESFEKPLAGAIFDVWYPSGEKYGSFSTDESGTITLPINVFGNYTVTERVPPQYHILPEISTQHVTVTALTGGVLTFWDAPYGSLRVHKISDTGENLVGVSI